MLFVVEFQFSAAIHVSYRESGTIISLLEVVLKNAFTSVRVGTEAARLKSNTAPALQPLNAYAPMDEIPLPNVILVRLVQYLNNPWLMLVTPSGRVTFTTPVLLNALFPIAVTPLPIVKEDRLLHPSNALDHISSTLLGMVTLANAVHP